MLWKWAKRRHPKKPRKMIVHKYWHTKGKRNWVFSTTKNRLRRLSDKRIIRNPQIKLNKNPYTDKEYFIEHKLKQGIIKLSGRFKKVWVNQKDKCHICNLPIDISADANERNLHHKNGNHKDFKISNLVYVHVHCHRQFNATNPKTITAA